MPRLIHMLVAVAALGTAAMASRPDAMASSPDAWSDYDKEVAQACFKASGFKDPVAHSQLILFSDDVGRDALIVEGVYPQPHMNGAKGEVLCLFDKKARTAVTSEITHTH